MTKTVAVWFELPATDLDRAQRFYEAVFTHPMRRERMECLEMAMFDPPGAEFKGAVVKGDTYVPSAQGPLVYLDAGPDLAVPLERAVAAGGTVVLPKTSIAPHGFIALFLDSEGNRVGLHSME